MAAATDKRNGNLNLTGVGRNIFRSNHRCLSPMAQLKVLSPHSSMNDGYLSDLPSPVEDGTDEFKSKSNHLARDFISYKCSFDQEDTKHDETCRTLRRVGDEMVDRHQTVVNAMSKRLHFSNPSGEKAFPGYSPNQQKFLMIVNEICKDGQENWGRIVTVFVLGSILALNNMEHEGGQDIENIINFVGEYIATNKRSWIEKNGGWAGFVQFFNNGVTEEKKVWKGLLYAVGLGALATSFAVGR